MARTRGPGNLVARRPTTEARTYADAHQNYAAMIEQDLGGRRTSSYHALDEGRPPSTLALLVRPLSLFLFACTAFVIVLLLWLWQAGMFGDLKLGQRPAPPAPSASWMGARQAVPVVTPNTADAPPDPASVDQTPSAPAEVAGDSDDTPAGESEAGDD